MTTHLYTSTMRAAPALSATAGALNTILDACLRTGFGAVTAVSVTVAAGIATAVFNAGESFAPGATIEVSGANQGALNTRAVVRSSTSTQCTWATSAADGVATGTIAIKVAGAGWAKPFQVGKTLCLRSPHPDSTGCILRVDDSSDNAARVTAFISMTDANTGAGQFPTDAQIAGGLYWPKADNSTGTRAWMVVADERAFYLYVLGVAASVTGLVMGFGDLLTDTPDPWACFLAGSTGATYAGGVGCLSLVGSAVANTLVLARPASGVGAPTLAYLVSLFRTSGASGSATGSQLPGWPNAAHGATVLTTAHVVATDGLRGRLPGIRHTPAALATNLAQFDLQSFPGFVPVRINASAPGVLFVSTGEWRA